jgi:mono/diheme cytochrome c family protein
MPPRKATALLVGVVVVLAATGCRNDWRTDMWYQPSVRPEDAPRPEPERSVPLGGAPHFDGRDDTEALANPLRPDPARLAHGRVLFLARCSPCHGRDGHGGGPVSKYFPPAPDLAYQTVKERTDGFIWGTITFGGKAMPANREGLDVNERWELVSYVRAIQRGEAPPP